MNQLFITLDASLITEDAYTITIVGYSIVFASLLLLVGIFIVMSKFFEKKDIKKEAKKEVIQEITETKNDTNNDNSNEINAAISTALYLYFDEQHDEESGIITLKKQNTNWNAKIHESVNDCMCLA